VETFELVIVTVPITVSVVTIVVPFASTLPVSETGLVTVATAVVTTFGVKVLVSVAVNVSVNNEAESVHVVEL
jgi:hypothetical protein